MTPFLLTLCKHSLLAAAALGATPVLHTAVRALQRRPGGQKALLFLEIPALTAVLLAATASLVNGSFNPFLYFRF